MFVGNREWVEVKSKEITIYRTTTGEEPRQHS